MSREHDVQQQLEAAQAQIQRYAQQLAAERDAARQTQAQLQGQIEQQQRHIAQLEAQTHRLQWIINTSPATTYSCEADPPYPCTYISQSIETVLGYTPDEFKAEANFWEQRLHPEDTSSVFAAIPNLFEQGKLQHDYRIRHRDGHYVWIRDHLVLFRDAQGLPQEVVGYFTDISEQKRLDAERKQAEQRVEQECQRMAEENGQFRETLKAQEATYRHLFDCNPQPMWVYDLETLQFLAVNDAAIAKYGYARADFLAMTIADIRPLEDVPRLLDNVTQVNSGLNMAGIWQHRLRDGQVIQVEIVSYALKFEGRRAELVMAQDVTDRIRTEQALRHSEERYRLLVELAPQIVWSADMTGRHIYVSARMGEYVGLAIEQLMDFDWQFVVHPDDFEQVRDRWMEAVQTGMPYETEYRMRRANGDYRWHLSKAIRVQDDQEMQWLGMATDIHDRKQAELALQDLNQSLEQKVAERTADLYRSQIEVQAILNNSPAKIYVEDLEGRYIFVNQTFLRLFNCQSEDVVGKTTHEFFPPEIADTFQTNDRLLLEQGGVQQFEEIVRVNGEDRVFLSNKFLLRDEQGEVYALCGMSSDITDRKAMEAALQDSYAHQQAILAALPDHVFRVNREGRYLDCYPSEQIAEMSGLDTLVGRTITEVLPPEVAQAHLHRIEQALSTQTVQVSEQVVEIDGMQRVREVRVAPCGADEVVFVIRDITDRKQAEMVLRESEQRYTTLAQAVPAAIFRFDLEGNCIYVNEGWCKMTGKPAAFALHEHWLETVHPDDREHTQTIVQQWLQSGTDTLFHNEARILRDDGIIVWFYCQMSIETNASGQTIGYVGTLTNITERKQAEIELRDLTSRLTLALEAGAYGTWDSDLVHDAIWDERMYEIYGLQDLGRAATYQDWRDRVHPDDLSSVEAQLQMAAQGEAAFNVEFRIWRTDGELRWIQAIASTHRDADGNPVRMVGINYDNTERKTAERALRDLTTRLTLALQVGAYGTWTWDLAETLDWDEQMYQIFGLQDLDHPITYAEWIAMVHPDDLASIYDQIPTVLNGEKNLYAEFRIHRPNGEPRWIQVTAQVQRDDQGHPVQMVGINRDITYRKQAELDLQHTNAELARATRLKDEFLANMSHELRTPLNAILGMTEGLQEEVFGPITDRQRRSLTTIETSSNHLLSLINDVLDVAKIESGQFELDYAAVNVHLLCDSSLTLVKQQAHKKRLHIETHVSKQLPEIYGDERRLRQMLVNLLSNAVKFTPEGGHISVTASYASLTPEEIALNQELIHPEREPSATVGILTLSVADTGIGISPENANKLFQPFIQIDSSLNRQYQGTGLGLALVKRITEIHGGKVTLISEIGSGSCFTLQLPIVPIPPGHFSATAPIPSIEATVPLDPATAPLILLAEDNAANVSTITAYLTAKGYALIVAKNGLEAVNLANNTHPNLILMDIQMPQLNGLDAIRQIRQNPALAAVPIVALTALAMPDDRERCLAAGADDYISKPIRLNHLGQLIPTLLTKPSTE